MLDMIRSILLQFIDDIDSENCNLTNEQQVKVLSSLVNIAHPELRMSKMLACEYLGVCRSTFDNYVKDGFIPKGYKQDGFKELSWNRIDLDMFLKSNM